MSVASPRAIAFDFDGVILESADVKTEAFVELFADWPEHRTRIRDYHLQHVSLSRYAKFEWIYRELLRRPLVDEENASLGRRFSELVLSKILACPLVPGVPERLEELRRHFALYIVSGTPSEELLWIVNRRGLTGIFSGVYGYPPEKPHLLRTIMQEQNLQPSEAIYVGDTFGDYEAARTIGMAFVARFTQESIGRWRELGVNMIPHISALRFHPEGPYLLWDGGLDHGARSTMTKARLLASERRTLVD